MKKISLLFAMLTMVVSGAWASIEIGKHYTIQAKFTTASNNVYLGVNTSNELTFLTTAATDKSQIWVVRASGNSTYPYKFESESNAGYFLSSAASKGMSTTGGWFTLVGESGGYSVIKGSADTDASTTNAKALGTWNPSDTSKKTGFGGSYSGGCWSSYDSQYSTDVWSDTYIFTEVTDDCPISDGYYYIKSKTHPTRNGYLYNYATLSYNTNKLTMQSASNVTTNNGIWKIEATSSNTINVVNGDGKPLVAGNSSAGIMGTYSSLTIYDYATTDEVTDYYFSEALNCSNKGSDFRYNSNDDYCYLTTWATGGSSAPDNRWIFENLSTINKYIYNVVVKGNDNGYATLGSEYAYNGGFFISDSEITEDEVSYLNNTDYTITKSLANNTITITYTSNNATAADITAAKENIKIGVGYPLTNTEAYTNLNNLTTSSVLTKVQLQNYVDAYLTETNILLPEDGKAYTFTNYSNNPSQNKRYVKYTNGSTLATSTTEDEASVFIAKKVSDGVYAFVTSDGNFLTWPNQGEGYTEGSSVYGYSTSYRSTYSSKDDWNLITVKKDANESKNFGHLRLVGRRGANTTSAFIIKGSTGAWDKAGDSHFLDESGSNWFSSAWILTEVTHTNNDAENCAIAKVTAIEGMSTAIGTRTLAEGLGNYHVMNGSAISYDYKASVNAQTTASGVESVVSSLAINQPAAGFYRFLNVKGNHYLSNSIASGYSTISTTTDKSLSTVYEIITMEGGFALRSYETQAYLWNPWHIGDESTNKKAWVFKEGNVGYYAMYYIDGHYMTGNGDVTWYSDIATDENAQWTLEPVMIESRTTTPGSYGTICLPYDATATGAVVMEFQGRSTKGLVFDFPEGKTEETSTVLTAGVPYLYRATANKQAFTTTTSTETAASTDYNGFVGVYTAQDVPEGKYFLYTTDNLFHPAGSYVHINAYKCYFDKLPDVDGSIQARSNACVFGIFGDETTGVQSINTSVNLNKDGKFVNNGRVVIVKNGQKFNVAGQAVK